MMLQRGILSTATPDVAVILVNYHGWRDTLECLDSLLQLRAPGRIHVFVTDNASTDDSVERILDWIAKLGQVRLLEPCDLPDATAARVAKVYTADVADNVTISLLCNKANDGFAAGNNLGMDLAEELFDPGYFWILNNDTLVQENTLEYMLARMDLDPAIGICGATLLYYGTPNRVQAYGGVSYSFATGRGQHVGTGTEYAGPVNNVLIEKQLSYISGASMLVSREFLSRVGPMCEDYFLYCEEIDWAWRARGLFKLAVETAAIVYHKEGASIGTESIGRPPSLLSDFFQARNRLRFASRHTPWYLPSVWLFLLVRAAKRCLRGRYRNAQVMLSVLFGRQQPEPGWFRRV